MSSYLDIRELLSKYGFDGDNLPIIKGSARQALEKMIANLKTTLGEDKWVDKIYELDVFSIAGRGTVLCL